MDHRNLGRSGLRVSPLCRGTMMFGGATDETTSARIIHRARDQGINFIDAADVYNGGRSEASPALDPGDQARQRRRTGAERWRQRGSPWGI